VDVSKRVFLAGGTLGEQMAVLTARFGSVVPGLAA
jgi:hypothetical protein